MTVGAVPRRARATVGYEDEVRARMESAQTMAGGDAVASAAHAPTLAGESPGETKAGMGRASLASRGGEADVAAGADVRYLPVRTLGEGGMGEVVLAHDVDIGRKVAIKRPHRDAARAASLLVSEVRTLGKLDHPNIITVYDVDCDETGLPYYTMKFQQGESVGDVLERLRRGDPDAVRRYTLSRRLDIFAGVLRALTHAHAQGIVHRDVKPDNVLVGVEGEVTLADWGIAVEAAAHPGEASVGIAGTPGYMSPEQARGEPGAHGPASDVYSAFAMLFELLTLRPLVDPEGGALDVLQRNQEAEAPSPFDPVYGQVAIGPVPAEYRHFLRHGLERDRAARYASAEVALETLERVRSGDFPTECPITWMKNGDKLIFRVFEGGSMLAAAALVLVVVGGFGALILAAFFG